MHTPCSHLPPSPSTLISASFYPSFSVLFTPFEAPTPNAPTRSSATHRSREQLLKHSTWRFFLPHRTKRSANAHPHRPPSPQPGPSCFQTPASTPSSLSLVNFPPPTSAQLPTHGRPSARPTPPARHSPLPAPLAYFAPDFLPRARARGAASWARPSRGEGVPPPQPRALRPLTLLCYCGASLCVRAPPNRCKFPPPLLRLLRNVCKLYIHTQVQSKLDMHD